VNHRKMKWTLLVLALLALVIVSGCNKKKVPSAPQETTPPTTPPQPVPTASLTVRPESIQPGGSATLTWSTTNATNVNIDGIGAVATSGSQSVTPSQSTTYHLTAQGPGGTAEASARLTVSAAATREERVTPPPTAEQPSETEAQLFAKSVKDIHFDYDKSDIRPGDDAVLSADAAFLQSHPTMHFTIFGQCDERGSTEYNLALGDRRANTVREALLKAGVHADQMIGVKSSGKECPICSEHTEECWQANRRAHFVLGSIPEGQQCPSR
jgi:peptidoglycan-associated lipoprotein